VPKNKPVQPKKKPEYPNAKVGNYRAPIDTTGMAPEDKEFFFPKKKKK